MTANDEVFAKKLVAAAHSKLDSKGQSQR